MIVKIGTLEGRRNEAISKNNVAVHIDMLRKEGGPAFTENNKLFHLKELEMKSQWKL